MDCQSANNNSHLPTTPIVIKASLKHHTVQEIYDYLQFAVGEPAMKIKRGQAIIGFDHPQTYLKLLENHKISYINNKKIQFIPITKEQERSLQFEIEEKVRPPKKNDTQIDQTRKSQPPNIIPNGAPVNTFLPANHPSDISSGLSNTPKNAIIDVMSQRITHQKTLLIEKLQNKLVETIQNSSQRANQIAQFFKAKAIKKRELFALQAMVRGKMERMQQRYESSLFEFQIKIKDFSRQKVIDQVPTFGYQKPWEFKSSFSTRPKFNPKIKFTNQKSHFVRGLAAINNEQFAASMIHQNEGYIKLYNVKNSQPKKSFRFDFGVSSVCTINNFLVFGCYNNTIKYINLRDQDYQIDSSQQILPRTQDPPRSKEEAQKLKTKHKILLLKQSKSQSNNGELYAYCNDGRIRYYIINFDEPFQNVISLHFQLKWFSKVVQDFRCIQVINPGQIIVGHDNKLILINAAKNQYYNQIPVDRSVQRIKRFHPHLHAVADTTNVKIFDLRMEAITQVFCDFPYKPTSLQTIGPNHLVYGTWKQIGLLDDRRPDQILWKSPQGFHQHEVNQIIKVHDKIISGDREGNIFSWSLSDNQMKPQALHNTSNSNIEMGNAD